MFDLNYLKMMIKYISIIIRTNEPFAYESIYKKQYTLKKKESVLIRSNAENDLVSELSDILMEYIFKYCVYFRIGLTSVHNLSNISTFI